MGLDMYLSCVKYAHNSDNSPSDEKASYGKVLAEMGIGGFAPTHEMPFLTVSLLIGNWKNAHQVHDWLIANALNGEDIRLVDQKVERKQLYALMDLCEHLLLKKDRKEASELLPSPGCLTTDEDWGNYWLDLEDTVQQLGIVLHDKRFDAWEFFYQAS
jgi:hypothetical protein